MRPQIPFLDPPFSQLTTICINHCPWLGCINFSPFLVHEHLKADLTVAYWSKLKVLSYLLICLCNLELGVENWACNFFAFINTKTEGNSTKQSVVKKTKQRDAEENPSMMTQVMSSFVKNSQSIMCLNFRTVKCSFLVFWRSKDKKKFIKKECSR